MDRVVRDENLNTAPRKHSMKISFAVALATCRVMLWAQPPDPPAFRPEIPKTWDDAAISDVEVPLADPAGSPKHVSADYYYKIPVRPIYKSYTVFASGHEPPGYADWLKQQEPVIVWDDNGH